jgi:hypothetical protein
MLDRLSHKFSHNGTRPVREVIPHRPRRLRHGFAVWQRRAWFDRHVSFHVLRPSACLAVYRRTADCGKD